MYKFWTLFDDVSIDSHLKGKMFCKHLTKDDIDDGALWILNSLARDIHKKFGFNTNVNSGGRCVICNKRVGGKKNSAHLVKKCKEKTLKKSKAWDVSTRCKTGIEEMRLRYFIVIWLVKHDFKRFKVYPHFVHLDIATEAEGYAQEIIW